MFFDNLSLSTIIIVVVTAAIIFISIIAVSAYIAKNISSASRMEAAGSTTITCSEEDIVSTIKREYSETNDGAKLSIADIRIVSPFDQATGRCICDVLATPSGATSVHDGGSLADCSESLFRYYILVNRDNVMRVANVRLLTNRA